MKPLFCECEHDGWCNRFHREMTGRFREICQGVNCDLGTSASFREQWKREAEEMRIIHSPSTQYLPSTSSVPISLLLITDQAPGDAVAMTAAIYSLHKAHPNKYLTAVESPYDDVFRYNPDVVPVESLSNPLSLHMHYPAIHSSNIRGIHFMQGWCEFLGHALGIQVPLLTNRPHLYLKNPVKSPFLEGSYWVICSGGKSDFTNKLWGHENYQEVVTRLKDEIIFLQVGATPTTDHPRLSYVEDWVGHTTLEQLFYLVRSAAGVICGVSLLMHVAAAFGKPCVVIAGGREPVQWNAYPKQHYLHTVGLLGCTSPQGEKGACWRSRTVPLGDGTILDEHSCLRVVNNKPECMTLIKPQSVVELIQIIDRCL